MSQTLRVHVRLPRDLRDGIMRYLAGQPLMPNWKLKVDSGPRVPLSSIDVVVTTPALLDRRDAHPARTAPVVLVVERTAVLSRSAVIGADNVRGLVFADAPPATLALGVAVAATHGVWIPVEIWRSLGSGDAATGLPSALGLLTHSEAETLHLLARGMTNKQIAAERNVQISTVKYHVANIRSKLGGVSRPELIALAHRSGAAS